jgi:hypothetical protein
VKICQLVKSCNGTYTHTHTTWWSCPFLLSLGTKVHRKGLPYIPSVCPVCWRKNMFLSGIKRFMLSDAKSDYSRYCCWAGKTIKLYSHVSLPSSYLDRVTSFPRFYNSSQGNKGLYLQVCHDNLLQSPWPFKLLILCQPRSKVTIEGLIFAIWSSRAGTRRRYQHIGLICLLGFHMTFRQKHRMAP